MKRMLIGVLTTAALLGCLGTPAILRAEPPKILLFRVQEVNQKTYFHLRVQRPADLASDEQMRSRILDAWAGIQVDPFMRPRLAPQDDAARLVFLREPAIERVGQKDEPGVVEKNQNSGFEANTLDFYGVFTGEKTAAFLLIYPKARPEHVDRKKLTLHELLKEKNDWVEEKVLLEPAKAKKVPMPAQGFNRDEKTRVQANDLEGNWALAQAAHFALLEAQTPDFGFYGFARATTSRQFKLRGLDSLRTIGPVVADAGPAKNEVSRLYELTTGASAITESLALDRLRNRGLNQKEDPRSVPIGNVQGIDIDEHPWKKMMGDKKPAPEPLAKLIPHDNYYIHFRTFAKFLETADLFDEWGTSVARAYEVNSRDYRIKQKLEQQICLKSTGLARLFGPAVIKSLAITGNDPYLREGSDFTIIFQLADKTLFQTGAEPTLSEAKQKFGKSLHEAKAIYQGVAIDSFVTPLREVSLHRAYFDDVAVFSNSGIALRRVIDAHKNKIKRLADSLDFQYMRTVFHADDPTEDGFVFLSDAFIRNLVGPAVRIKERRRLEALTSLHMVTNGAMYTAWETGKAPQSYEHIVHVTGMTPQELFMPDGNAAAWNGERKIAHSSVYNTQHFATPLIELPIDSVTPTEQREYEQFRLQYLGLWRQYFDPIGMRISLAKEQIKTEIYLLPLVRTTQYNELRRIAGDGTVKIDASMFGDKTLLKYLMHLSPHLFERDLFGGLGGNMMADFAIRSWLGDWFAVSFDDSPIYAKLMESYLRSQMFPEERHDFLDDLALLFDTPLTIGVDVRSPVIFAGVLTTFRKSMESTLPGAFEWAPLDKPYKGVPIMRIKTNGKRLGGDIAERRLNPTFYYALIDDAFYVSFKEAPIKDLIDRRIALKDGKGQQMNAAEVNSSLYLGPKAAVQAKDSVRMYLEYEAHRRAQTNNRLLYALFRSNVVGPQDDSPAVEAATLQYLGFVPVSPNLAPFRYEWLKEEVINLRHGSVRQPKLNLGDPSNAALGKMLEQFATIRADLRFREDGIHTTLTMIRILKK